MPNAKIKYAFQARASLSAERASGVTNLKLSACGARAFYNHLMHGCVSMPQLPLFDGSDQLTVTPLARNTDPATSHGAAREHKESGRAAKSAAEVLAAVKRFPGMTAVELASKAGLDRYEVSRRLADLRDKQKLVRNCGERECRINHRNMQTWIAV